LAEVVLQNDLHTERDQQFFFRPAMIATAPTVSLQENRPPNTDWLSLAAGNQRCRQGKVIEERLSRPIAILDFTTADRPLWEIFDCDSRQLFIIRPHHSKLSTQDLSALEYITLLGGAHTLVLLTDATSATVPPPGYERLIWHIDPEYCGRERQQEQLRSAIAKLNTSPCLQRLFLGNQVETLMATYDASTIRVELVSLKLQPLAQAA
jgi:hypothetical protein